MIVTCPRNFDDSSALLFLNELENLLDNDEIMIDFSPVKWARPFGTLLIATGIRSFVIRRKQMSLKTSAKGADFDVAALSYLRYVGFFPFIGIGIGNRPNEANGSTRYLPITRISKLELQSSGFRIQEEIEKRSRQLASIISFGYESRSDMLSYCFRETIRNVFEHAETDECIAMAQRWFGGNAEIAIVDEGRGLFASLSETHSINDRQTAISEAIKPGVSRVRETATSDRWQNSGFGLYVVSELGNQYGSFTIASDNNALLMTHGEKLWASAPINGTALKLNMTIPDPDYFSNIVQSIVTEGEKIADLIPGARKKASQVSSITV